MVVDNKVEVQYLVVYRTEIDGDVDQYFPVMRYTPEGARMACREAHPDCKVLDVMNSAYPRGYKPSWR